MTETSDMGALLEREDHEGLVALARTGVSRVLRFLTGRLYSTDHEEKFRAVRALGGVVRHAEIAASDRLADLLRRFFWALNAESGAVPYGVPEAIGEILAVRPEMQRDFLSPLCSMLVHEEMIQTGPIERGVVWALGRIGPAAVQCEPEIVSALRRAARDHPEEATRALAAWALDRLEGGPGSVSERLVPPAR
ncbi:MAG: DVU0298 family protein [Planctomycetota bacterium]